MAAGNGGTVPLSLTGRTWRERDADPALATAISQRHGLPEVLGRVLAARGVGLDEVETFLAPRLRAALPDPAHLLDMDRAVARLADAVEAGETVGILGDFDVDGATSSALLARYLHAAGTVAAIEIPDRLTEGYGPNAAVLARLTARGCRLIVTVDTGVTAFAPLAEAAASGLEVVVVDHHKAEAELPHALAVINPNRLDQTGDCGSLAAVGVVFLLVIALNRELRRRGLFQRRLEPDLLRFLDLVALGTVCDVVPLKGLNRALVTQGLKVLPATQVPGLAALCAVSGALQPYSAYHLGFLLGPRINAGGRIGNAGLGAKLLTTDDPAEAQAMAAVLDKLNRERQALEKSVLAEAMAAADACDDPVVVLGAPGWHPGVIGIVASRIVERVGRPAILIGLTNDEGRGSGRSVPGFDLGAAVIAARREGLLREGGGHPMAAGLKIAPDRLDDLRAFMREKAQDCWNGAGAPPPSLTVDGAVALGALRAPLAHALERLAPFGAGNPAPCFRVDGVRVAHARPLGTEHIACRLVDGSGASTPAVAFRAGRTPLGTALAGGGGPLTLAGRLRFDDARYGNGVRFVIEDGRRDG